VGNELQSEWSVDRAVAGEVFRALRGLGEEISASLFISEVRAVAADDYWLSPFYDRDAVTFHFTWRQTPTTPSAIRLVEEALRPYLPRPHWGKLSNLLPDELRAAYPRVDDFLTLRREFDPDAKFANAWSTRLALT
jgi:xylitol oxidase